MKAVEIEKQIDSGKTLFFATYAKAVRVDKKCLDKWRKSGVPLFKDGDTKADGFYIGRGRHYDYVMANTVKFI